MKESCPNRMITIFKESDGQWSMRRFLAFLFAVAGLFTGIFTAITRQEWQVIVASFCAPAAVSVLLLICTTITDVTDIVKAVKG
jgi:hypothetical protein